MKRLIPYLLALAVAGFADAAQVDRVLRRFTFEERAAGNMEDVPMDWVKIEGPGRPHYVNGGLTTDQACNGKYSFGFKLDGGSLVYRYPAGKIIVHPDSRYRLNVMAKTLGVVHSRARLTAYFADATGKPMLATIQHSKPLKSTADEWSPIAMDLTAPEGAASLVIELGLVQPALLKSAAPDSAAFDQDITGQAWFDDLTVAQVPYVQLSTTVPGNVFRFGQPASVDISFHDRLTDDLVSRLDITDADGGTVYQQSGTVETTPVGDAKVGRVVLPTLPAGWYRANLRIESNGTEVGRQVMSFVQLADDASREQLDPDRRVGLIATAVPFARWNDLPKVLPMLGGGRVKLAVWSAAGDIEHAPSLDFNKLIDQLKELQITPTACLIAPPPSVADPLTKRDWASVIKAKPDGWQPPLAAMLSRYSGYLDRWQFCADDRADEFPADPKLRESYLAVLQTMNGLFSNADLAMPWPIYSDAPTPAPSALAMNVPTDVLPEHLPLYVGDAMAHGHTQVSLSLSAPEADRYGRPAQLRDFAQRIGYAFASNATRIDLPLPFNDALNEPTDTFLLQRTLVTALAGASYQGHMPLGDDLDALLFDRDGEGVLLAWTKSPQAKPRSVPVMLGRSPRAVDLSGNISPVLKPKADDGTTEITVGPTPGLIVGIDGMLARLRTSFAFDNPLLESSYKPHVRRLLFKNPYPTAITGRLKLIGPAGWNIVAQTPTFNIAAGESYDGTVTIEFPFSSTAGLKPVELSVELDSGAKFKVPLSFRLGLGEIGVESSAFRDGPDVIVQQVITNYGTKPANFTAWAALPGWARQERMLSGLKPGTSSVKRYRFINVGTQQKIVRSGVRETQGTRALTDEITLN